MGMQAWNVFACLVQATAEGRLLHELVISCTCPFHGILFAFRRTLLNELIHSKIFLVLPVIMHWIIQHLGEFTARYNSDYMDIGPQHELTIKRTMAVTESISNINKEARDWSDADNSTDSRLSES